jgi:hypothetical protein
LRADDAHVHRHQYDLILFPRSREPAFSGGQFETLAEALATALKYPECAYEVRDHTDGDKVVSASA